MRNSRGVVALALSIAASGLPDRDTRGRLSALAGPATRRAYPLAKALNPCFLPAAPQLAGLCGRALAADETALRPVGADSTRRSACSGLLRGVKIVDHCRYASRRRAGRCRSLAGGVAHAPGIRRAAAGEVSERKECVMNRYCCTERGEERRVTVHSPGRGTGTIFPTRGGLRSAGTSDVARSDAGKMSQSPGCERLRAAVTETGA